VGYEFQGFSRRVVDIGAWLQTLGLERYERAFREHDIDEDVLRALTADDLIALGVASIGHRRKILAAVSDLVARPDHGSAPPDGSSQVAPSGLDKARSVEAERRQLTVMFVDLVGSTALSVRLDPEEMSELLSAYRTAVASEVERFEGHVAKYMGDGVVAYFGWPQAHEDDAERAIRAGLALTERVARLAAPVGEPLSARVGIATGLVVVGDVAGEGTAREEVVTGETPNLAARLQELAGTGGVVIGRATRRLLGDMFELDDLGSWHLKGFPEPLAVWRVTRESPAKGRFRALHGEVLTPLVGREHELMLLFECWARAKDGDGRVVLLGGEPGIGKSRIAQAFSERLRDEAVTVLCYFCSLRHRNSALQPVLEQLGRAAGFVAGDPPEAKLAKLKTLFGEHARDVAEAVAVHAPLFSVPVGEHHAALDLVPERRRRRSLEILVERLEGLAAHQPVLVVLEDAHWIDPTTRELFDLVVERIRRLPVLLLVTFRPEFGVPWAGRGHVTQLLLDRLGRHEAAAMVERLSEGKGLPTEVLEQIITRADGVPLFVEELTKAVLESGQLHDAGDHYELIGPMAALAIPASLHDSLMARLDRLGAAKEIAQIGAVIGREFSHALLAAIAERPAPELDDALSLLLRSELIFRRGTPPDVVYEFKHALVHDAAYASLLLRRRQELHERIGRRLEERFADTATTRPELLAHHFAAAGRAAEAVPYALRAGRAAAARYSNTEARARFEQARDLAQALPPSETASRARIEAALELAGVAQNRGHYERDLESLEQAHALAEAIGDQRRSCRIEYWIGRISYVFGRFDQAVAFAGRALASAEALGGADFDTADPADLLGRVHCLRGEPREAITYAARSVEQMRRLGNRIEEAAMSGVLAFAYGMHGEFDRAFETAGHGVELARRIEHLPTQAAAVFFSGVVRGWHGDLDVALPQFDEALALCEKSGDLFRKYLAHGWRGQALLLAGRLGAAGSDLDLCLGLGEKIGTTFHRGAFQAFRAKLHLLDGRLDEALRDTSEALGSATETARAWSRSIALTVHAEVLASVQPPAVGRAMQEIDTAIGIQEAHECFFDLAWTRLAQSRILTVQGAPDRAADACRHAERSFAAMGVALGTEQARAALETLSTPDEPLPIA
jgi:class 3 adenylate cyclase/tetratricopeptide (TPR) repeat protein